MRFTLLSFLLLGLCCPAVSAQAPVSEPKPSPIALKETVSNKPPPSSSVSEAKVGKAAALSLPPEKKNP
ncbi:MAG TPA: hypothetical protein VIR01_17805, partial [Pyrinomonadaceae bacterium]